ncbi:MAG: EamA family transporter [Lentisphaerae bacterium]|nr:EamA family transporter [Lentisphaerota bacterium]
MILGIICGLVSALSQCLAYISSKKYIHKDGTPFQLLIASHLLIGGFAGLCLGILLLKKDLPPFKDYWLEVLKVNGFYMFGQMCFFLAIGKTEASRVAPLLGFKIIFIALFGIMFMELHLSPYQWGAIILCCGGAMLSNWSGKSIPLAGILWLLGAIVSYSLSDISIKLLINCIENSAGKGLLAFLIAVSLTYFYLGIFSLFIVTITRSVKLKHLKPALPFACWWFGSMLFLFVCFGLIGPLFGNIVQSVRGIIAVIIGAIFARFSWTEHEEKLPRQILVGRLMAALLITVSVVIFILAKS